LASSAGVNDANSAATSRCKRCNSSICGGFFRGDDRFVLNVPTRFAQEAINNDSGVGFGRHFPAVSVRIHSRVAKCSNHPFKLADEAPQVAKLHKF
jgi:hypothetical protein